MNVMIDHCSVSWTIDEAVNKAVEKKMAELPKDIDPYGLLGLF